MNTETLPSPVPNFESRRLTYITTGREALGARTSVDEWTANSVVMQPDTPIAAQAAMDVVKIKQEDMGAELADIRARIGSLDEHGIKLLDTYLEGYFPPPKHGRREGISKWLASGEGPNADQKLLDVLRWHEKVVADQEQSPRFMAAVQQSKAGYLKAQRAAIENGYVSEYAATKSERIINANVYVGDLFNTLIMGAQGWHPRGPVDALNEQYIVIAQGLSADPQKREDEVLHMLDITAYHEFNHIEFDAWMASWREEAIAEHLDVGYRHGHLEALEPTEREQLIAHNELAPEVFRLFSQRQLLNYLRKGPNGEVPIQYVTQACTSSGPASEENHRYNEATDAAWGASDVNYKVDYLMWARQKELLGVNNSSIGKTRVEAQAKAARDVLAQLQRDPKILADENWTDSPEPENPSAPPTHAPERERASGPGRHARQHRKYTGIRRRF